MNRAVSKGGMADDRTLVARFKSGDESAFNALVERYSGKAYQIAYGVLANREDAEEVAEDVFVRIHRALPKFRGDSEFTTWMYRIAMNLARNKYRWNKSRESRAHVSIDAPLEGQDGDEERRLELPDTRITPDRDAAYKELSARLQKELESIPEVYRQALVMKNMDDMSYEDIAAAMNCKMGTVKSRISRAREELRRRLGL